MKRRYQLVLSVLVTATFVISADATLSYTITDLGTYNNDVISWGKDINNSGQILAWAGDSSIIWQNGQITDLGFLPGGNRTNAMAINNLGQVTGNAKDASGISHAFLWSTGNLQDLGTINGYYTSGLAINDTGQIVGADYVDSVDRHAFLYDGGSITDINPVIGAQESSALSINNSGTIVGDAYDTVRYAFTYTNGVVTNISEASGHLGKSYAYGINDLGQVVGNFGIGNDEHAFLYSYGIMTDLDTMNTTWSTAEDINNYGQIVGKTINPIIAERVNGSGASAVLWDVNEGMLLLDDFLADSSPWDRLHEASAINDLGQIVGYGSINGQVHAFVMTPAPEPATLTLLALGSLFIAKRRK